MPQASTYQFLRSNNPLPNIVQQAGSEAETQIMDTEGLDRLIQEIGIQAVFDRYFGPNGSDPRAGLFSLSSDGQTVNYRSDAENSGGGLSGFMNSEAAPATLFGLGAAALGSGLSAGTGAGDIASGDFGLWNVTGNELGAGVNGGSTLGSITSGSAPNIANMQVGANVTSPSSFALSPEETNLVGQTGLGDNISSGDFGLWDATLENAGGAALGGTAGTVGAAGAGATVGATTLSSILSELLGDGYSGLLGALLEYMNQGDVLDMQQSLLQQAIDSDLWRGQQERYFEPLYTAATQGIGNTAYGQSIAEAADRFGASRGYGSSSNMLQEIARGLNSGTTQYINALTPLATGRGGQGSTYASFAPGITGAMQGQSGALGAGLQSIISGYDSNAANNASAARQADLASRAAAGEDVSFWNSLRSF